MSGKREPDWKRGRHKKRGSRETKRWEVGHLIPTRPPWMSPATYTKLARMRDA